MKSYKSICRLVNTVFREGQFVQEINKVEVRVMAIAGRYAMVRIKRAMPFVCNVKDLEITK